VQKGASPSIYWAVINNTGGDRRSWDCVSIDGMQINETDNQNEYEHRPTFQGGTPSEVNKTKFAILQKPAKAGQVVNAAFHGPTLAWVDIKEDPDTQEEYRTFAEVAASSGEHRLQSSERGGIRIVYAPPGTGEKLCWVILEYDATEAENELCWPTDNIYVRRYECDPNPYYVPASPGEETDCCDHDNAAGYLQEYLDYYRWDQALCNWVFEEATTANRVIACCDPECKTHSVVPPGGNPPGCDACPVNPGMFALAAKLTSIHEQYDILLQYDADAQVWIGQIDHLFTDDIGVGQVNVQAQLFVDCWQGPSFGAPNNTQALPVALACNWADRDNPIVEDYNEVQPGVPYKGKLTMQTDALAINTQCGGVIPQNNTTIGVEIFIGDCQW